MASLLTDKRFWLASAERAVLTTAQALAAELAVFSTVEIKEEGLAGLPWYAMVSVAVVAGLGSLLTSIGKGSKGSPGYKVALRENEAAELMVAEVPEPEAKDDPIPKPGKPGGSKKNR